MMKKKYIVVMLSLTLMLQLFAAGCGKKSGSSSNNEVVSGSVDESIEYANEKSNIAKSLANGVDYKDLTSTSSDCTIKLADENTTISGTGAAYNGGVVTITAGGTYEISGSLNGRIEVNATKDDKINIILDGVSVNSNNYAPFVVWQADKTLVYLNKDTTNTFGDAEEYDEGLNLSGVDTPTAAVFSKDDIGFAGEGSLVINASCKNGIVSKNDLLFESGSYDITATEDCVVGKDCVGVNNAKFNLSAGADAIKSNNDEEQDKGFVAINDGEFIISARNDGLQAETYCYIKNGKFDITTTGNDDADASFEDASDSSKAIKAGSDITILDGEFKIASVEDAFHSDDTITIEAGKYTINCKDDGIHADKVLLVNGGTCNIEESYEGLEAECIVIVDGDIGITASDDGINAASVSSQNENDMDAGNKTGDMQQGAANRPDVKEVTQGGADMENRPQMPQGDADMENRPQMPQGNADMENRPQRPEGDADRGNRPQRPQGDADMENRPQMPQGDADIENGSQMPRNETGDMKQGGQMGDEDSNAVIYILGGEIYVNAGGDGIDSNGSVYMSDGTMYIDGPENSGNGALDYNITFDITGGTLIAAGSSGMLQSISDESVQAGMAVVFESYYEANTKVSIKNSEEKEIISYSPSKKFNSIIISSEELKVGESYEVLVNEESLKTVKQSSISVIDGEKNNNMGKSQDMKKEQGSFEENF